MGLAAHQDESVHDRLFPHPARSNGLEEVAVAIDLARRDHLWVYQAWSSDMGAEAPANASSDEKELYRTVSAAKSALAADTMEMAAGEQVLELLDEAVAKPLGYPERRWDPSLDNDLGSLISLERAAAHVSFAQGDPAKATRRLVNAWALSEESCVLGSQNYLSMALDGLEPLSRDLAFDLAVFSVPDLERLQRTCDAALQQNATLACIDGDEADTAFAMSADFDEFVRSGTIGRELNGSEPLDALRQIESQTQSEDTGTRQAIVDRLRAALHEMFQAQRSHALQPEKEWLAVLEQSREDAAPSTGPTVDQWMRRVVFSAKPSSLTAAVVMLVRCETRILRLHTQVLLYRWRHARLPLSLPEAGVAKSEPFDPLSGKDFLYKVDSDGRNYRIYADVTALNAGRIELGNFMNGDVNALRRP